MTQAQNFPLRRRLFRNRRGGRRIRLREERKRMLSTSLLSLQHSVLKDDVQMYFDDPLFHFQNELDATHQDI